MYICNSDVNSTNNAWVLSSFGLGGVFGSYIGGVFVPSGDTINYIYAQNIGLEELDKNAINLYPNPTSDFISISFETSEPIQVQVLSLDGKLYKAIQTVTNERIDVYNLSSGTYIVQVKLNDAWSSQKIIIQ